MIPVRSNDPSVLARLRNHPGVSIEEGLTKSPLSFGNRTVEVGKLLPLRGLVEIVDNNPLICTNQFSVPSPLATLILIAVSPLIDAGLLLEPPVVQTNLAVENLDEFLGFEATISSEPQSFGSVGVSTVISAIQTPARVEDLDDLYEERYGRSFYVRRAEQGIWDTQEVAGKPHAAYRLRIAPDNPSSLLTVQVMADLDGKLGSAQVIHAFNVMNGFEETAGIL